MAWLGQAMTMPKPKPRSNESNDMGNPSKHESELQAQAQTRNAKYYVFMESRLHKAQVWIRLKYHLGFKNQAQLEQET